MAHLSNGFMFQTPRRFPSIIYSILIILNKLLKEICGVFETDPFETRAITLHVIVLRVFDIEKLPYRKRNVK